MLAWKVDPWALSEPAAHAGAGPPDPDAVVAVVLDEPVADVVELVDGLAVLLSVPHAAAANSPPAVSTVAAMREVLTGTPPVSVNRP
jgi:hypothetical protein